MSKKRRSKNLPLVIISIIFFLFLSISAIWKWGTQQRNFSNETVITQQNLSITIKDCDETIDPWNPEDLGVKESQWLNDDTLFIKTHIHMLCGGESISKASYTMEDTQLELLYSTERGGQITRCICAKELDYTISDLPFKDYSVSLRRN